MSRDITVFIQTSRNYNVRLIQNIFKLVEHRRAGVGYKYQVNFKIGPKVPALEGAPLLQFGGKTTSWLMKYYHGPDIWM